jgi:hypothetical protein
VAGPVRVHRNRHKRLWSVVGPGGKVLRWANKLLLADVEFLVQPAGWRRAVREGVRNVHARAKGAVRPWTEPPDGAVPVRYDLSRGRFIDDRGRIWANARQVWLNADGSMTCYGAGIRIA